MPDGSTRVAHASEQRHVLALEVRVASRKTGSHPPAMVHVPRSISEPVAIDHDAHAVPPRRQLSIQTRRLQKIWHLWDLVATSRDYVTLLSGRHGMRRCTRSSRN